MQCPECKSELKVENFKGMEVKKCPQCAGLWLDLPEMDQLEDTVYSYEDDSKGTRVFSTFKSDFSCPVCQELMQKFNYRYYDLVINFCPKDGYWLEKDEEKRILELMKEEAKEMVDDAKAEKQWADILNHIKSPSFWNRLKSLFK